MDDQEGLVKILGYNLYYRSAGAPDAKATVLALHGGPGGTHDYLLPLRDLTRWGYRVVFFDQLACGQSEIPPGTDLFTLEHHVEETEGIRTALGLGRVHLIGSSYGGLLALAYAIKYQQHLRSLVTIGMMVAMNRADELRLHLRAAANSGVTRKEIQEVLLQTAIYCGVPAANTAFHIAEEVFAEAEK